MIARISPGVIAAYSNDTAASIAWGGFAFKVTYSGGGNKPAYSPQKLVVPGAGFEPATFGLQNRCTTTVLTRQYQWLMLFI
jgi:hypothetical protein